MASDTLTEIKLLNFGPPAVLPLEVLITLVCLSRTDHARLPLSPPFSPPLPYHHSLSLIADCFTTCALLVLKTTALRVEEEGKTFTRVVCPWRMNGGSVLVFVLGVLGM